LVRKVEPYFGKYKGILATNNMVQLKRYYGSATGSIICATSVVASAISERAALHFLDF